MITVLIIDDEIALLHLTSLLLNRSGYRTLTAATGADGLRRARAEQPDVILLDELMPDMRGSEVCRRLKEDPLLAHIPVIIYSGGASVYNPAHLKRIGAAASIPKPSPFSLIRATI